MGKTITTYLIDEDPKGAQYVLSSNKICKMVIIPRANLSIVNRREELQTPVFYILVGEDDAMKPEAYIGETENFKERECVITTLKKPFGKRPLYSCRATVR